MIKYLDNTIFKCCKLLFVKIKPIKNNNTFYNKIM